MRIPIQVVYLGDDTRNHWQGSGEVSQVRDISQLSRVLAIVVTGASLGGTHVSV